MSETRVWFTVIPLFVGVIGLCFCFLGIVWLRHERAFARNAIRAEGTVVGFERRRYRGSRISRRLDYRDHPVIRYTTRDGQAAQFESPIGTAPRFHREGQQIPILYNPANPAEGRIAHGCMQVGPPIFLIIFGLVTALFSGIFAVSAWGISAQLPAG